MDVRKLYENIDDEYFSAYSYWPMIDSFGKELVHVDDENYQGDTRVLLERGGNIGLLIFGWGSCSGCDALQACTNYKELQDLYNRLESSIQWWDTDAEALKYFNEHDWEGDYSWREKETKEFVKQCKEFLGGRVGCKQDPADCGRPAFCKEPTDCCYEGGLLNTYVWEGVLTDWTSGMVVVTAPDLETALSMLKKEDEMAWRAVKDIVPVVSSSPQAFVVYGGG